MAEKEGVEITIKVPMIWYRIFRFRPFAQLVLALFGVSITFLPYALFTLGERGFAFSHWAVLLNFVIIYIVAGSSMRLGALVMIEIMKPSADASALD